jgi:hypothetical protein
MDVTYTSEKYDPNKSYARYVRKDWDGAYHWCEVGLGDEAAKRQDYRQGKADAPEIPEDIRDAADALCGYFPSYVDWPSTPTC